MIACPSQKTTMPRNTREPEFYPCPCSALRKSARAVSRQYETALAHTGISATQYSILHELQREGALPLSRLAEHLVMDRTSLYRTIRPLQTKHLVKTLSTVDQRVKVVSLTPAGHRKIREALPYWADAQRSFLKLIGADNWLRLSEELREVTATVVKAG